jgi:hypothetical protein
MAEIFYSEVGKLKALVKVDRMINNDQYNQLCNSVSRFVMGQTNILVVMEGVDITLVHMEDEGYMDGIDEGKSKVEGKENVVLMKPKGDNDGMH